MIISKNFSSLQVSSSTRTLLGAAILIGVSGCSGSLSSMLEPDRVDYKSAGKAPVRTLEIPPNLTQLQRENRYSVNDNNRGTATASGYTLQQQGGTASTSAATSATVAPGAAADMRVERAGNQRWLVIKQTPEVLWPQIKDFWQESGFLINVEMADAGVIETDWAESRLKVPQGNVRSFLGKALDSIYDTGLRDKFRTRLERLADGSTEIYISHRGAQEVFTGTTGNGKESTMWTTRPSDPELEAQFLSRMMTRLGAEEVKAKATVANASPMQARAKLVKTADRAYVEADESFDRAWRRVGLALDRVGFTVEDRDRTQGVYFVRYVDQERDAQNKSAAEQGFFSKLFSFGSKNDPKTAQRYRVSVKQAGSGSQIEVLNAEGRTDTTATAGRILSLLNEQLK